MPEAPDFHGLAEKAAERTAQHIVEQHKDLFSPAKRAELGAAARATVIARFDSRRTTRALAELYAESMNESLTHADAVAIAGAKP